MTKRGPNDTNLVLTPRPRVVVNKTKPRKRRDLYELDAPYVRTVTTKKRSYEIWVAPNFLYDGASIPRIGWDLVYTPFNPRVMAAAAIHDWLYQVQHMFVDGKRIKVARRVADGLLWYLMRDDGVPKKKRRIVYDVVRAFGKQAWKTHSAWDRALVKWLYKEHGQEQRYAFPDWAKR